MSTVTRAWTRTSAAVAIITILACISLTGCANQQPAQVTIDPVQSARQSGDTPVQLQTPERVVAEGELIQLSAQQIQRTIDGNSYTLYGYGMDGNEPTIPGPRLRVRQGSRIRVNFTNHLPEPTTVHWHGLRHDYRDDGMPGISQDPVQPGQSYVYNLYFPDASVFWYHPHIREDRQQNMGLYANIIVDPLRNNSAIESTSAAGNSPTAVAGAGVAADVAPAAHEEFLMLNDLLVDERSKQIIPYGRDAANNALMGRYGNVLLVNGQTRWSGRAVRGETVRFAVTNAANVRPFNLSIDGAQLTVVASDISRYEHSWRAGSVVIGPAERMIFDVTFDKPGTYHVRNTNLWTSYDLGEVTVTDSSTHDSEAHKTETSANADVIADIDQFRSSFDKPADETIILDVSMGGMMGGAGGMMGGGANGGMGGMMEMHSVTDIEWEDTMSHMNAMSTSKNTRWILRDVKTGRENMNLTYTFHTGQPIKLRIVNTNTSVHPMQHDIHLHGQRFLVIDQNGVRNQDLAWKDTVLVPAGGTTDILIDASNPGTWMLHCHIAEHLEAGMMALVQVVDDTNATHEVAPSMAGMSTH